MVADPTPIAPASPILPSPDTLSLSQLAAQMIVVRTTGHLFDHEIQYPAWEADQATLNHYVQNLGVGGVILLSGSAAEVGLKTRQLQSQATVPLLIAADVEEGVGQRFTGATWFPPPMALGAVAEHDVALALAYAEAMGRITAQEATAIGINWLLAPVVDINNNPQNPVINVRAFGGAANRVESLTKAFIQGAQEYAVLTTAKHFPGHGDTDIDSHLELPVLPHTLDRLHKVEWLPFKAAIAAGVDAVMTAHVKVPALDSSYPATLSAATLTDVLRHSFGFSGLIVTDALVMESITRTYGPYEAAVLAVEAGADVLLMPHDPEGVIHALEEAVVTGRLPQGRLLNSVERLWRAKQRCASLLTVPPESCHAWEHVPPPAVDTTRLGQPNAQQWVTDILSSSMTIQGTVPPCPAGDNIIGDNIVIVDNTIDCPFLKRTAAAVVLPARLNYHLKLIDQTACQLHPSQIELKPSLLQVFIRGNPFRGSAASTALINSWIHTLWKADLLMGLVIYGSPYIREQVAVLLPDNIPLAFSFGQMPQAQAVLLQKFLLLPDPIESKANLPFTD